MSAGGFGRNYDEVDVPPPWDDDDASPNHPAALASKHRGQVRMAYRLAAAYGDELMFVHGIGWHAWDGSRWREDHHGEAKRAVLDVFRGALASSLGARSYGPT